MDSVPPGTRIISPKVATITPVLPAMEMAASTSCTDVTQTGQPGPLSRVMLFGMTSRIPCRNISTVCVPQTSISFSGLPMPSVSFFRSSSIVFILSTYPLTIDSLTPRSESFDVRRKDRD